MFRCLTFILFLFCFYSGLVAADKTDDNAPLLQLDKMIERREVYQKEVEKKITELRKMLDYVGDDKAKFDILSDLFVMYRFSKVDTALIIAEERLQLANRLGEEYVSQGLVNLADALNKIGKHEKTLEVLDRVRRAKAVRKDTYFYYLYHTTYLSCYNDETEASKKRLFMQQIKAYKDVLIAISDPNTASCMTNKCGHLGLQGKRDEAIQILSGYYEHCAGTNPDKASVGYLLAELYLGKRDMQQAKHFLIQASVTDIVNAKKVYMSLRQLAILLFQEGDIARAYSYISCSSEDVSFGEARYRIIDIAEYFPIIKAANDSRIKADRDRVSFFLLTLSILVIALVIVFLFLRKKNRNLLKVKQSLAEQNRRLQEVTGNLTRMNEEIKESDHVKEEYIGLLFNTCSEYIYKQKDDRKSLLKIVNTGFMADISKMPHNQSSTTEDFKLFINKFNTIFLSIFPDFVESFNTLLKEGERIQIKEGELLTPELRIYALIRLGINNNSKITSFLHYSPQTVYNYRLKMRNKAIAPGKDLAV